MDFRSKHQIAVSEESLYWKDFFARLTASWSESLKSHLSICAREKQTDPYIVSGPHGGQFISIEATPLYLDSRHYSGAVLVIQDQTDSHRIDLLNQELELQRAKSIESSKLAALGEMAGGIAHEINTPLAIIHTTADQLSELLQERSIDAKMTTEMASTIVLTAERISKIILSMRSLLRDGTNSPGKRESVQKIVGEVLALCSEKLKNDSIQLELGDIPPSLSIYCQESEISQVLLNLINNAKDALESFPENLRWIRIDASEHPKHVDISVTDAGSGIPSQLLDRIFNPFFTTKDVGKGTGIGLSISRKIAESYQGDLFVDTASPNTRFVLRLPKTS